ncbi:MAG TPA: pectin acetylesterase-family hydrolase [Polyangiaceae bacterium]|jgi:hypothetical protein|nr:pectin acetylesterase-family hydrolase [Polyangiaceae bacterium]
MERVVLLALASVFTVLTTRPAEAAPLALSWGGGWQWYSNGPNPKGQSQKALPYNAMCMNNTPTGIGIYAPTAANWNGKVMYWFDGGGVCYDQRSCAAPASPSALLGDFFAGKYPLAPFVFRDHFNTSDFWTYVQTGVGLNINGLMQPGPVLDSGVFDHDSTNSAKNPFKNYVEVFVPYCTGDFHVGFNNDTASTIPGRIKSGINFNGWANAVNAVSAADLAISSASTGKTITQTVVAGGSAGGYGSLLLYGTIRALLPTTEHMITISDAGTPYATGQPNAAGTAWTSQGYLSIPPGPAPPPADQTVQGPKTPSKVSYMEDYMADAFGSTWSGVYPASLKQTPKGAVHGFYSIQSVIYYNYVNALTNHSFRGYGDRFYVIDGNNDYIDPFFFNMFLQGNGTPTIATAQSQVVATFGTGFLYQVTNAGANITSGSIPWSEHHGYLGDDIATWDSSQFFAPGSGVKQFLSTIPL